MTDNRVGGVGGSSEDERSEGGVSGGELSEDGLTEAERLNDLAAAHLARFEREGHDEDLERAVVLQTAAAQLCGPEEPSFPLIQANLGYVLCTFEEAAEDASVLPAAAEAARLAAGALADDRPEAERVLSTVVWILRVCLARRVERPVLEEALKAVRRALALADPEHRNRRLEILAALLRTAVDQLGDHRRIPELLSCLRELAQSPAVDRASRPALLAELASVLRDQYDRTSEVGALAEAVSAGRELAELLSDARTPRRTYYLSLLGVNLRDLYRATDDPDRLAESVEVWREAVAVATPDELGLFFRPELAVLLQELGERTGAPQLLREAVDVRRAVVDAAPDADAHGYLGEALAAAGDPEATARYREAVRLSTDPVRRARWESGLSEVLAAAGESAEAVALARAAAAGFAGHPGQDVAYHRLANRLCALAGAQADPELMAEATAAARALLACVPEGSAGRAGALHELGQQLFLHFKLVPDRPILEEAVTRGREAVAAAGAPGPASAVFHCGLGRSLHLLARFLRDGALLAEAETELRTGIAAAPADHRLLPSFRADLAEVLLAPAAGTRPEEAAVRESVALAREAVAGGEQRALAILARALTALYEVTDDPDVCAEGIAFAVEALRADDGEPPASARARVDRGGRLMALGDLLRERYARLGEPADLDRAIDSYTAARALVPAGHISQSHLTATLWAMIGLRWGRSGGAEDETLMIRTGLDAAATVTDPRVAGRLRSLLAFALQHRNQRTGDPADLDAAVRLCRDFLAAEGADDADRIPTRAQLCYLLRVRYSRSGDLAELDEAVEHGRAAVASEGADPVELALWRSDLSAALRERAESTNSTEDIDEAVEFGRLAAGGGANPGATSHYAGALAHRFQALGELDDLHKAVRLSRTALQLAQADAGAHLSNLGANLARRDTALGTRADLDEAIGVFRDAVAATGEHHQSRPNRLYNLAAALCKRYQEDGAEADLAESREAATAAAALATEGHPVRAYVLDLLGQLSRLRYRRLGEPADLDRAVGEGRTARDAAARHPALGALVGNLASYLLDRFELTGSTADLDEAVSSCRTGLRMRGQQAANLGVALGRALAARFEAIGDPADAREAVEVRRAFAEDPSGRTESRLAAAVEWGGFALDHGLPDALQAYRTAVPLQRLAVSLGADRADRERILARWRGLAGDAAEAALAADDPVVAVELLEQGRGVLWSQLLDLRTDLAQVERRAPELVRRLVSVRKRIDRQE
ncbi:hypothetical protein [Kitasatospora sp. NPDC090091]|uniref:hypothetical protein n=1 Tax=Kitasatospora sp. NPDC090091 TaxID=3364081 RepID=UPI003812C061